jgi:phosphatidylserine decarboxylase
MIVAIGVYYALGAVALGAILGYLTRPWAGIPFYLFAAFCLWFFRDPDRTIPAGPVAVSPADGKVVLIRPEADGRTRVAIFLNVFDVHVNRAPVTGRITAIHYRPGKFMVASRDAASIENEQNTLIIETQDGPRVEFSQIAGLIARRIICHKKPGDLVGRGERIGLIQFGSRVDVLLGREWKLAVKLGDRLSAGSSILAQRAGS